MVDIEFHTNCAFRKSHLHICAAAGLGDAGGTNA